MTNAFKVHQRLPGLNQYINLNRRSKYAGARMKKETDNAVGWAIKKAMLAGKCRKVRGPVRIRITWYESSRRRDLDNIFSAKKFILDAMQKMWILEGDSQKYVTGVEDNFVLCKSRAEEGAYVEILEAGAD